MNKTPIQVLLIEDNPVDVIFLREALGQDALNSFDLVTVERLQSALVLLQENTFDVILLDLGLPDIQGFETYTRIQQAVPQVPKVILSGLTDESLALQVVQAGAQDYIVKGTSGFASAARAIRYAIERQQAQAAVRASEERFRALIEHGSDDISLLDVDGNLLWESPAVVRNLGYPENTFVGHNIFELIHPDDKAWTKALYAELVQNPGDRQHGIFRLQHADGSWRWVEATLTNMLENPSVYAVVANYHDITERKQAEDTIRSLARFPEENPNAIARIGVDGRIIYANSISQQQWLAEWKLSIGDPLPTEWKILVEAAINKNVRQSHDVSIQDRTYTILIVPFRDSGYINIYGQDITESRRAEEKLREKAADDALINSLNEAANRRESLAALVKLLGNEFKQLFSAKGTGLYLLSEDGKSLNMPGFSLPGGVVGNLEKLIGRPIPPLKIPIRAGGMFQKFLQAEVGTILTDPQEIQEWMTEFTGVETVPSGLEGVISKLRPTIFQILGIRSTISLPLASAGKTFGLLGVSSANVLGQQELERLRRIGTQLSAAIQRKQDEQRLQESNERFEQLANNIEEAFWITNATTGEEIYLSPASEQIWGMSLEELMQPNAFLENVITEDRSIVEAALGTQGHGEKTEIEYRTIGLDGTIHWIWDRAFPIFDGSGKVVRVAGIAADITERKIVDEQLRKLSSAVRQSASIIVITDTAGNIEYVNPKFTEITGYTFEEAIGQNPRILKSGHTSPEVYESLWNTIKSGQEWHGELQNRKKNGALYWESVSISPIFNERGETTHFIAVKEDISDRKNNEVNIRRNLAELEALYENGLAVGRLLNQNEIGERIIATFARHLSWHHVAIRLIQPEGHEMKLIAFNQEGLSMAEMDATELHLNSTISKVGQGLSGWVVQTGQPLRTGNVHAEPQYVPTYPKIQSGLYMPLKLGDLSTGVISVESEEPYAFTEQDERLLATLANQAAIAFENARLYQSAQQELQERGRAETALRISETHYRELADSITDIFFELDQNLHYTHWNKASEILTGVPAAEAIGKSMREIFGESEEQTRIGKIYESVLIKRQPRTFETIFNINDQPRDFEVNAYPSTHGVAVVAKDVTERKKSETIMQKRFELMEYAARHSLAEIMQMTIEEVSKMTGSAFGFFHLMELDQATPDLQIWPRNTLSVFNVPVSEGRHRSVEQAGVWADAVRQRRAIIHNNYESLSNKKGLPTGHAPIVREMVFPIIRNERILAVMGIANKPEEYTHQDLEIAERFADYAWDITDRKQMELALAEERNQLSLRVEERTADLSHANADLARALRVKDEFLANMSHELRTPLNSILGLSESLAEQTAGPLNEKQQRYITTVNESGHHLLSLINDILDLAKIEAGQITLDVNRVDINSVCQSSLRMIKQLAGKKNQEVVVEIDGTVNLMWADERRLKQMLVNLLGNAVKFTPEGGKLGLEVHGDQDANKVTFTIWDTGIGIIETDLPRLFQPFVQLDAGLARESSGTGLGLALVAQMARLHGGSASVTSQPGKGSRFTIMLPWEPALALDTVERLKVTGKFRPVKFNQGHRPTILLIEDTQEVIMMISDYLEMNGFNIVTAYDGVEGVNQAQHTHPDLILMDIQMPRMDGFEATKKLRSDPEFEHTPIVALTALAMPNDRERCLAAGMDEYITKPVHLRALVKIIENFLSGEQEIKEIRPQ